VQVGLLLTIPSYVGLVLDPIIGLLGDTRHRKLLIVGGALLTALAALLVAGGDRFVLVLVAFCLSYPASTAYVSLSQATLMDLHPGRHEKVMARWAVLGSAGDLAGPLLVAGVLTAGLGWRSAYLVLAALAGLVAFVFWRQRFNGRHPAEDAAPLWQTLRELPQLIRQGGILRWLVLMELADLLLDVLYSFTALYFTDVAGASPELAGVAVAVLTAGGLLGDVLLIPLLEKYDGVRLIRRTTWLALALYVAFLLVPGVWLKLAVLVALGPVRSGWWQVLQGRAYAALPGRSGTVIALGSLVGLFHASFPVILGAIAQQWGLASAMACLALGPVSLIVGLPRRGDGVTG
jgi:FSR family fosmidomycin resistance protein-like MFS transporter